MRRVVLALALSALATGAQAGAPDCIWLHGRLSAYNGFPTFRISPAGSRRILGVVDANGGSDSSEVLPGTVRALVMPDAFAVTLFGDFQVCPLEPDRPGRMRRVQLRKGRNLITRRN